MNWVTSNWIFIVFVGGMAWMHLGHGRHGGMHGAHNHGQRPNDQYLDGHPLEPAEPTTAHSLSPVTSESAHRRNHTSRSGPTKARP